MRNSIYGEDAYNIFLSFDTDDSGAGKPITAEMFLDNQMHRMELDTSVSVSLCLGGRSHEAYSSRVVCVSVRCRHSASHAKN